MRKRFRYDPDLEAVVEIRDNNYFIEGKLHVITDDIGAGVNGLRAMHRMDKRHFDSKSAFRQDVKAAGLAEVGNETNFASARPRHTAHEYGQMAQAARQQIEGNWNGTRDWLARQNERRK